MRLVLHKNPDRHQFYRCIRCGARSCCGSMPTCAPENPFGHLWRYMGSRKPYFSHTIKEQDANLQNVS